MSETKPDIFDDLDPKPAHRPWRFQAEITIDHNERGPARRITDYVIYSASGPYANPAACEREADAEFIVRAVNVHDDLLELAKLAADVIDDDLENRPARHSLGNLHARLVAAIAKAEAR